MITGDHQATAAAIADDLQLRKEDDLVLSGQELEAMSDGELTEAARSTTVYARVSPEHKVRIVEALKRSDRIVSMTGDGVNDAPALKRADIGVAMGITGTDVAKGAADMILTDDNFGTIVNAVEEGRVIYANIRKVVSFLLSCNVGEILVIFITTMIMGPSFTPLLPVQLLWLNLVTDSSALALGRERQKKGSCCSLRAARVTKSSTKTWCGRLSFKQSLFLLRCSLRLTSAVFCTLIISLSAVRLRLIRQFRRSPSYPWRIRLRRGVRGRMLLSG